MEEITIPADVCSLELLFDFIGINMQNHGLDEKIQNAIELATEEIFVNIASYAYTPETGDVKISLTISDKLLVMGFSDSGKPYNPLAKEDPDLTLPLSDREVGGLGIYMVKNLVDDIHYEYKSGLNVLTISKSF